MPFNEESRVVVLCDGCGDGWTKGPNDFTPDFTSYDAAREHLDFFGWTVAPCPATSGKPARTRLVCPDCTGLEACAKRGHDWSPWRHHDLRRAAPAGIPVGWIGWVRECRLCPDTEWDPPLAPGCLETGPSRPELTLVLGEASGGDDA